MENTYIVQKNSIIYLNDENNIHTTLDLIPYYKGPTYVFIDINKPFKCRIIRSKLLEQHTMKDIKLMVVNSLYKEYEKLLESEQDTLHRIREYQTRLLYYMS